MAVRMDKEQPRETSEWLDGSDSHGYAEAGYWNGSGYGAASGSGYGAASGSGNSHGDGVSYYFGFAGSMGWGNGTGNGRGV